MSVCIPLSMSEKSKSVSGVNHEFNETFAPKTD